MTAFSNVHHVEMGVLDGPKAVELFTKNYTFQLKATRRTDYVSQWLLALNDAKLVITSVNNSISPSDFEQDDYITDWMAVHPLGTARKDSVFNIAYEVKNLPALVQRSVDHDVTVLKSPRTVTDRNGSLKTCVLKSCVGDLAHTLVERGDYDGDFLPGFEPINDNDRIDNRNIDSGILLFDHVALSVPMNTSVDVLNWYEKSLGMKRILINSEEDVDNGLVLSSTTVGLRLRAMEWWKCAETGLTAPSTDGTPSKVYMVISEGMPPVPGQTEENQVEAYIRRRGCPGINHIALMTNDIKSATRRLTNTGVQFAMAPPTAYYSKIGRLDDIERVGEDLDTLKKYGILIDTECDAIDGFTDQNGNSNGQDRYLLQIFTAPMLETDPFFLEIIQREGATGFGSGNIAALYRSVQPFLVGSSNKTEGKSNRHPVQMIENNTNKV